MRKTRSLLGFRKKLSTLYKHEIKSEFTKNALTLFTGVSISQIIPFFISPILTRLYTPEEFGILALFVTTGSFFGNIATFHYESAIMLPAEEDDAVNVLALSLILTFFMTIFSLILVVFFKSQIVSLMNNEKIAKWLYFVPISVLLSGVFRSFSLWSTRHKQFKLIAFRNITQTASTNGIKVTFGFLRFTNIGLIFGTLLGQIIATSLLVFESIKKTSLNLKQINKRSIIKNAKKYKEFPLFTNWQGFFDMLNESGLKIVVSNFAGLTILGWFSFTVSILQRPLIVIGQSVSSVFYQRAVEIFNSKGNLWFFTKKIMKRQMIIGLIIFLPLLLFGDLIFKFTFGNSWTVAGSYVQILSPWLFFRFLTSSITTLPQIYHKQKTFLKITIIKNIYPVFIMYFTLSRGITFTISLLIFSVTNSLIIIGILLWFRHITKYNVIEVYKL